MNDWTMRFCILSRTCNSSGWRLWSSKSVAGSSVCTLKSIGLVLICRALAGFKCRHDDIFGDVVIDGPCSTEALVLKSYPLRESALIAVLYTRQDGRVSGVAR